MLPLTHFAFVLLCCSLCYSSWLSTWRETITQQRVASPSNYLGWWESIDNKLRRSKSGFLGYNIYLLTVYHHMKSLYSVCVVPLSILFCLVLYIHTTHLSYVHHLLSCGTISHTCYRSPPNTNDNMTKIIMPAWIYFFHALIRSSLVMYVLFLRDSWGQGIQYCV